MVNEIHITYEKMSEKRTSPLFEELTSVRYAVVKGELLSPQIHGDPAITIVRSIKNIRFARKTTS